MARAHIAYFCLPHRSHLNPTLPIVTVLSRRGHRVTYVTADRFSREIAATGSSVALCPRFNLDGMGSELNDDAPYCRLATQSVAKLSRVFGKDRPDLIIHDLVTLAGRILADKLNVPVIHVGPTLALAEDTFVEQVPDPRFRELLLEHSAQADRFLQRHGVSSSGFIFHKEGLSIHLVPKVLQPKGNVFGPKMLYAGRCAAERQTAGEDWQPPLDGKPLVLVSTSTSHLEGADHFKMCVEALSDLQWNIILSIGDGIDAAFFDGLPSNFSVIQHVSHLRILPYANLLMSQGG